MSPKSVMNVRRLLPLLLPVLLGAAAAPVAAQRRGSVETLLAHLADADRSGDVTATEWAGFVGGLASDGERGIDRQQLLARILRRTLDRNADGVVETADLDRLFASRDRNRNAVLEADEIGRRGALMDRIVFASADGNGDGSIVAAEWSAFLAAAKAADGVSLAVVQGWIAKAAAPNDADRTAMTPGVILMTMAAALDPNRDGAVRKDDLQAIFKGLDRNGDGALQADELTAPRAGGAGNRGGFPGAGRGRRITEADRGKPGLMPWQRSLDDALALVRQTGKPLLICVNMDGETACEQFAWKYYRDPEFARLARGFVVLLASPDRRRPIDHDDRGRRLVEPRFGRLINAEHIDHEPVLYEKYFRGQRVAPRHVGVDKTGKILFDIYLTNDLDSVSRALAEHGVAAGSTASADRSRGGLLRSPDAGDRAALEARFLAAAVPERIQLAGLALSSARKVQHPELLRLALRDPADAVRKRAVQAVAEHLERVPADLLQQALLEGFGDAAAMDALVHALHRVAAGNGDDTARQSAAFYRRTYAGLQARSRLIDAERWRRRLVGVRAVIEPPPAVSELPAIHARLDELEQQVREKPEDRGLRLAQAATNLRAVRIEIARGKDPTFLLQDVRGSAGKATSIQDPNSLALAHVAVACHLLDEPDTLYHAARALQALAAEPDRAASAIAAEVLDLFAQRRTRDVYGAMTAGTGFPLSWIADVQAAYEVLLAHPAGTEAQAVAYLKFTEGIQAPGLQATVVERAVQRFWGSADLHSRYRGFVLTRWGAAALEAGYDRLLATTGGQATKLWFAGLGSLMAAERQVFQDQEAAARAAYARCLDRFARSKAADPNFADSADHYLCLAHAGTARQQLAAADLDGAERSIRAALTARPATIDSADGLGVTPAKTAEQVVAALTAKGLDARAAGVQAALAAARQPR